MSNCVNCGELLQEGQEFCTKCGTPRKKPQICSNCGSTIADGFAFCTKCGQRSEAAGVQMQYNPQPVQTAPIQQAQPVMTAPIQQPQPNQYAQYNGGYNNYAVPKKKSKAWIGIVIAAVALIAVIIAGIIVVPKLFASVDKLCEKGQYDKAYEKAVGDIKNQVLAENMVAYTSKMFCRENNPRSFYLKDAWFNVSQTPSGDRVRMQIVLYVDDGNATKYWSYVYSWDDDEWEGYGSASSLSPSSSDPDWFEATLAKVLVESRTTFKVSDKSVTNINNKYDSGELYDTQMIRVRSLDRTDIPIEE